MSDGEDHFGRLDPARATRLLAQSVMREAELRWTPEIVKIRLREAARGQERLAGRVGPSQRMTFWIDHRLFRDVDQFELNAQAEGIREKTRAPDRSGPGLSEREIARIDEAIEWPMRYLKEHDDEREALKVWCWCEATRQSWSQFHHIACAHRSTANRRRDRAFDIICGGVERDGVLP